MPKPTLTNVYDQARAILADDSGDIYTDTVLGPHFRTAYRRIYRVMGNLSVKLVEVDAYFNLPAQTAVLDPATASITDVGEIVELRERSADSTVAISGVALNSNVATVTTGSAHGRSDGDSVVIYGVMGIGGANGLWTVAAPTTTTLTLNGSYLTGTYSSGGYVSFSSEQWSDPLEQVVRIDEVMNTAQGNADLRKFAWTRDVLRFLPASATRQLKIVYRMSGTAPTSGTDVIHFDDSLDFLAMATAGYAAATRAPSISAQCMSEAFGSRLGKDGAYGGMLYELMQSAVRARQGERFRRMPFGGSPYWLEDRVVSAS